ncbi:MAG: ChbG/HpnK family deacetylase [Ignavibacteriaceae bacterium]|nr:ChbG/HpnK family deacetylase [Ignavibacteriaceae bacterium]
MDHVINDSILKGFREGIVTSTSLMANGKAFDHAVKLIKSYTALDIGIHL